MGRSMKMVSFTDEYNEELIKLNNESNGSKVVCELLRSHYNEQDSYTNNDIKKDMTHIKTVLDELFIKLVVKGNE